MKAMDVQRWNDQLRGFSEVVRFDLSADGDRNSYALSLLLEDGEGHSVTLICSDVQNLELNPAGDGFEQMMLLKVTDMREDGLDRIRFSVEEMEHETLFLHCASVEVTEAG